MSKIVLQLAPSPCKYTNAANTWAAECGGRVMFEDASRIARSAVAEYLANRDGYTLYESKVGLEVYETRGWD